MQTLYIVLIIIGVIIGLMALLVLLETMTKQENSEVSSETQVKTVSKEKASCGTGACSSCSFQLFETKDKKIKGDNSCNIY